MFSENLSKLLLTINKSKETYKILTREEELELIKKYRDTDLPLLKNLLISHNIYLAISFSKKYCNSSIDYDSLLQDAFYGLAIAADRFDFDAGVKFSRYAYIWIKKYALSSYYERHNMHIGLNSVSLDTTLSECSSRGNSENDTILADIFDIEESAESSQYDKYLSCSSSASEYERNDIDNSYHKYFNEVINIVETSANISLEEKQIFKSIFINGETLKTVAEYMNKTVQNIRYKKLKILEYLRVELRKKYGFTSFASLA